MLLLRLVASAVFCLAICDDLDLTYAQVSGAFVAIAVGAGAGSGLSVLADYRSRRAISAGGL